MQQEISVLNLRPETNLSVDWVNLRSHEHDRSGELDSRTAREVCGQRHRPPGRVGGDLVGLQKPLGSQTIDSDDTQQGFARLNPFALATVDLDHDAGNWSGDPSTLGLLNGQLMVVLAQLPRQFGSLSVEFRLLNLQRRPFRHQPQPIQLGLRDALGVLLS